MKLCGVCCRILIAGWSSPVARQAHNLKAAGSNPAPATPYLWLSSQEKLPKASGSDKKRHLVPICWHQLGTRFSVGQVFSNNPLFHRGLLSLRLWPRFGPSDGQDPEGGIRFGGTHFCLSSVFSGSPRLDMPKTS